MFGTAVLLSMKPLFLFSSCCLSSPFSLTSFSSLRLTNCELRNDLKKQDNFSMKAHLFCRKVVHFCPNVPHFLEGVVGRERKMKHFLHRWEMMAKKRLQKTAIRISLRGDKCVSLSSYSDTPL